MKLIVFTVPNEIDKEAEQIAMLFEEGLELLHLRKPDWSIEKMETLLKAIPTKHFKKIVIHSHFKLIEKYNLRGIHLTGKYKELLDESAFLALFKTAKKRGITVSTSVHTIEELLENRRKYDYIFLSPLFDSISKVGYKSRINILEVNDLLKQYAGYSKIFALGGVNAQTIQTLIQSGFPGCGLLGAIWSNGNAVENFIQINKELKL